ncbi:hypothetical protein BDZ97DRAFT_1921147 [Flammula alnicola]|nr:hypothetical protein BDZ97DRAFT_1921147 [Flammula alnicola]
MTSSFTEGTIDFTRNDETYQTYYSASVIWRIGRKIHLSCCTAVLGSATTTWSRNGKSTHLREQPPEFWTIDLFIDELVNLLNYFSIQDGFDLVGHS